MNLPCPPPLLPPVLCSTKPSLPCHSLQLFQVVAVAQTGRQVGKALGAHAAGGEPGGVRGQPVRLEVEGSSAGWGVGVCLLGAVGGD